MDDAQPNVQDPVNETQLLVPCRHLRSKGMYVYTDGLTEETEDDFDSTAYWCLKTMKTFGPDDNMVGGRECRNSLRSCHEPL
jgi:hypothetical protein